MNSRLHSLTLMLGLIAAGCSPLAPRPDNSKYFVLTPGTNVPDPSLASISLTRQLRVGVGPITFPDYLRRVQLVTRTAPNQVELSPEARWAEPLDKNFDRVLTENLSRLLDTQHIENYPWAQRNHVDYRIVIDVQRFEINNTGQAQLLARWIIKDGRSGNDLYASETSANSPIGSGDMAAAAALSTDLATLSQQIASRIIELAGRRRTIPPET